MIDVKRGTVVKALAGKEKGNFFVVLELKENCVIISDGRHRPIDRAKKKNIKHVVGTNVILSEDILETNKKIKRALNVFLD